MKEKHTDGAVETPADLRQRAEEKAARPPAHPVALSPEETQRLIHELEVHQIELETQNEELRRAQMELESSRARYSDLYDLAPVGYFTLNEKGLILDANLTGATLLGAARGTLIEQPLTRFIQPADQDVYYRHRKQLFETGAPQVCEMGMMRLDGSLFWARLDAVVAQDKADGTPICRATMSDITASKQAEMALRANEAKYRDLVENINDVLFTVNADGVIAYISPVAQKIFGHDPAQLIGHGFAQFIHPDDRNTIEEGFVDVLNGRLYPGEYRVFDASGAVRWVRTSSRPVLENERAIGVQGILTDITSRKRAEAGLRAIEAKYRRIVETTSEGVWVLDELGQTTLVNRQMAAMLGYTVAEMNGTRFEHYLFPEDREGAMQRFRQIGTPFEQRLRRKDGGALWTLASPGAMRDDEADRDLGCFLMVRDISERKQMEVALRESEAWHRSVLATAMDGVWLADTSGRLLEVNQAYCQMSGYSAQELLAMRIPELEASETPADTAAHIRKLMAQGEERFESRHRRKDGTIFDVEISAQLRSGASVRMVVFIRDITARRRDELALASQHGTLRAVLENTEDMIAARDREGRLTFFNAAFGRIVKRLFGVDARLGVKTLEYLPEEAQAYWAPILTQVISGKRYRGEFAWTFEDGITRHFAIAFNPIVVNDAIVGYTEFNIDITERRQMEEALAAKLDELERFRTLTVDRELRMIEIKKEINALLVKAGEKERYKIVEGEEDVL